MRVAIAFSTCALLLVGCASSVKTVEVKGKVDDRVKLAGKWKGHYRGLDSGRKGTVEFKLDATRHYAFGHVLMYPTKAPASAAKPLQIKFVEVHKGEISGKIDPYVDPRCKCEVQTEFVGELRGNAIHGRFTTHIAALHAKQTGTWVVYRQAN